MPTTLTRGSSGFDGIKLLSGNAIKCYHLNDYPADPPRETIRDEHQGLPRIDGIAPLTKLFKNF